MQHKLPIITEVNSELVDFDYYFRDKFDIDKLDLNFSVNTTFTEPNSIVFFIHIRFLYDERSLFHTDYLSMVEIVEIEWEKDAKTIEFEKNFLAQILGISIIMIRGALHLKLKGHVLKEHPMPVLSPINILSDKLESKGKKFIITQNLTGHDEEE